MGEWMFTGRSVAYAQSMAALLRKRPGVLVTGPPGAGRTRFARELRAGTVERQGPGAWITGGAATAAVPLGAFAALTTTTGNGVAELRAAAADVVARCRGVLVVDDAHLLDPASTALLHHLVTTREVPAVVTAPAGRLDGWAGLWKDGHLARVDLEPASVTGLRDVLEAGLDGQVEDGTAARLHATTGGDLALVRSVVADETAAGRLRPVAGVWLWSGEAALSPRTVDLLDAHVPVPAVALPAVERVAAAGALPAGVLERMAGGPAVEAAEHAGLLVVRNGWVQLAVPLLGALVVERAGATRMRRLRAEVRCHATVPAPPRRPHGDLLVSAATAASHGRYAFAARRLRDAIAVRTAAGQATEHLSTLLAQVLGMRGDAAGAAAALAAAGSGGARRRHLIARAWAAAAAGSVTEAVAHAQHAAVLARDGAERSAEVAALHAAVRFGDPSGAARLATLADTVAGADLAAAHASALAAADGSALDAVAARLADRGAMPAAADAAAQAADAHERAGAHGKAVTAAARAHDLAHHCDDAVTPALRAAARPLPLTAREREVTSLAAHGMTNKEIAARLVVSVRTVEGHLYRACAKLHVDTRSELEAVLG